MSDTDQPREATVNAVRPARIVETRDEAEGIRSFTFLPLVSGADTGFAPGDHIRIETPAGPVRSYSLIPTDPGTYRVAVRRVPQSRGGSASLFAATVGDVLNISAPANGFSLAPGAGPHVLIAGGIGITPILSMVRALQDRDADWHLYYLTRSRAEMAFLDLLGTADLSRNVTLHHDEGDAARMFDLWPVLGMGANGHVHCCGPAPLMQAVRSLAFLWPPENLHFESFGGADAAVGRPFRLTLARSGRTIDVPADRSVLDALRDHGLTPPSQCGAGTCGTCLVPILEGQAEHRDFLPAEPDTPRRFALCVSRAAGDTLTLDL